MNKYMKEAIAEARCGITNGHGGPFGSVIVKDGQIIGKGHNMVVKNNDPTCHGEIMAIRDACKNIGTFSLKGCEIYTTAQPCPMCQGAVLWAGIEKVFYGCNIDDTEKIGFNDSQYYEILREDRMDITETDRPACLELFEEYRSIENKTMY